MAESSAANTTQVVSIVRDEGRMLMRAVTDVSARLDVFSTASSSSQSVVRVGTIAVMSAVNEVNSNLVDLKQSLEKTLQQRPQGSSPEKGSEIWECKWKVNGRLFPGRAKSVRLAVQRAQLEGEPAKFVQSPALLEAAVAGLHKAHVLLVKGLPGKGKTHVMASLERWLQLGGSHSQASAEAPSPSSRVVTASHFCSAADGESLDASNVLWSLVGQLGDRCKGFRSPSSPA